MRKIKKIILSIVVAIKNSKLRRIIKYIANHIDEINARLEEMHKEIKK